MTFCHLGQTPTNRQKEVATTKTTSNFQLWYVILTILKSNRCTERKNSSSSSKLIDFCILVLTAIHKIKGFITATLAIIGIVLAAVLYTKSYDIDNSLFLLNNHRRLGLLPHSKFRDPKIITPKLLNKRPRLAIVTFGILDHDKPRQHYKGVPAEVSLDYSISSLSRFVIPGWGSSWLRKPPLVSRQYAAENKLRARGARGENNWETRRSHDGVRPFLRAGV